MKNADFLISFKVFQYRMDPNELDRLAPVFKTVSTSEIHFRDEQAFKANGFAAGLGTREQAGKLARALSEAGAVRVGFTLLSVPPDETSVLSSTRVFRPLSINYYSAGGTAESKSLYPGYLGWTLFAESSAVRNTAIVRMAPAYWQPGAEDIRVLTGREPIDFNLFEFAEFQTRMNEGEFLLLAPSRFLQDPLSLNQGLFVEYARKNAVTCYVIFCESAGL